MDTFIDLSHWNETVDFQRVKQAGICAALLNAGEGLTINDPTFEARAAEARAANLDVGAYFFGLPAEDATKQAEHFLTVLEPVRAHLTLRTALDFETVPAGAGAFDWIVTFNHVVEREMRRFPLFYSYTSYIQDLHLPRPVGSGLWLSAFGPNDGADHGSIAPTPWRKWLAHQYASTATVHGVSGHCDISHTPAIGLLRC